MLRRRGSGLSPVRHVDLEPRVVLSLLVVLPTENEFGKSLEIYN